MSIETNFELLISVIVPAHADLQPIAESLAAQSYRNWELCLDGEPRALQGLMESFGGEQVRYCEGTPAIELARGALVTFLQPGCTLGSDHLLRATDAFAESANTLDLVYTDTRFTCTAQTSSEDFFQSAVALPYHLLGMICGEQFSSDLKSKLPLPVPAGPLSGAPFVWRKPNWDSGGANTLAHYNFIDLSDAVMTRRAYEAAGGLKQSGDSAWRLWLDMLRSGHRRFHRIPHAGIQYTTTDLAHHRQAYARSVFKQRSEPAGVTHKTALPSADPRGQPRVLFIGEALAISHVARPAMLAAHLHGEGYDVCFARDPRYSAIVSRDGIETIDIQSLPTSVALDRLARAEPVYDAATLDRYVQDDLQLLRDFKPDIVVGDQRHSLAVSSRLAGVPYVNIADAQWCPSTSAEYELPDSPLSRIVGAPLSQLIFQFVRPAAFALHTMPLNVIRVKYGLPGIGTDITTFFTYGDYTVYPNDPDLFPLAKPLPAGHSFVGPLEWSAQSELPDWWDSIPEDRPIVYVSLGSTGQASLLGTVFDVLAGMPVTGIAVTAGRGKMPTPPDNVKVADFLPGAEAARRSRLVICNGGSMSGQQALSAGTPYLGLISNLDQMLFTKAVHRTGACEWMRACEAGVTNLRPLVQHMLTQDRYVSVAKKLASRAAKWDARANFAAVISSVLENRNAKRYRSA
jgi:UDP:flavonoid glycosyltransferase YjiC (YdhE family)